MHMRHGARACVPGYACVRACTSVALLWRGALSRCCRAAVAFARRTCGDGCRWVTFSSCGTGTIHGVRLYIGTSSCRLVCGCVRGARAAGSGVRTCAGRGLAVSVGRGSASLRLARSVGPWSVRDRVRRVTGPSAPRSVRPTVRAGRRVAGGLSATAQRAGWTQSIHPAWPIVWRVLLARATAV